MANQRRPGPLGMNGQYEPNDSGTLNRGTSYPPGVIGVSSQDTFNQALPVAEAPLSGSIPASLGLATVARIPIPGTDGLCIELTNRGWAPKGGSTSVLFFQDISGKRQLRLDYGYNIQTKTVDYHWNAKGALGELSLADHTPIGPVGPAAYATAKYFRYAGRLFTVAAVMIDVVSIVRTDKPLRQASKVVAGWAASWTGCRLGGAAGAWAGTFVEPGFGTAIGGIGGCVIGGISGYRAGSILTGTVYDWAAGTKFVPLDVVSTP